MPVHQNQGRAQKHKEEQEQREERGDNKSEKRDRCVVCGIRIHPGPDDVRPYTGGRREGGSAVPVRTSSKYFN